MIYDNPLLAEGVEKYDNPLLAEGVEKYDNPLLAEEELVSTMIKAKNTF
jgi:hypothetical protein